jgi:transcriptional regulator with XRE-family HTH domain
MGRPSKFNPEFHPTLAESLAKNGLIDREIALRLGISESTLNLWKEKYPEFSESLKRGKEVVDLEVENTLLRRALGYDYTEVTRERQKGGAEGDNTLVITKKVTKQVVPDVTAQIFWLKNRDSARWRDRQEIAVDNHLDAEWLKLIRNAQARFKQEAGNDSGLVHDEPTSDSDK